VFFKKSILYKVFFDVFFKKSILYIVYYKTFVMVLRKNYNKVVLFLEKIYE